MAKQFSFKVVDVGLDSQRINLEVDGKAAESINIKGMVVPSDPSDRFWALYNKLVELKKIEDLRTQFEA